jgi:hypothetical protein
MTRCLSSSISIDINRTKGGILVYCKAHPDDTVIDAVDAYVKKVQHRQ